MIAKPGNGARFMLNPQVGKEEPTNQRHWLRQRWRETDQHGSAAGCPVRTRSGTWTRTRLHGALQWTSIGTAAVAVAAVDPCSATWEMMSLTASDGIRSNRRSHGAGRELQPGGRTAQIASGAQLACALRRRQIGSFLVTLAQLRMRRRTSVPAGLAGTRACWRPSWLALRLRTAGI